MVFSKKWLRNHPKFLLHFLIHIDVLKLCNKFEPIPSKTFPITLIIITHFLQHLVDSALFLVLFPQIPHIVIQFGSSPSVSPGPP